MSAYGTLQTSEDPTAFAPRQGSIRRLLFAVMELDGASDNSVYEALLHLHKSQIVFSFGVSDSSDGIQLYNIVTAKGMLVTGKPNNTQLPPPINQVPNIGGVGHHVHHKFVVRVQWRRPSGVLRFVQPRS